MVAHVDERDGVRASASDAMRIAKAVEVATQMLSTKFLERESFVAISIVLAKVDVDAFGVVGRRKREPGVRHDLILVKDHPARITLGQGSTHKCFRHF